MPRNYTLFDKHLLKIAPSTIGKFGSLDNVTLFLNYLCDSGNVAYAAKESTAIPQVRLHKIIKDDKYLDKCVKLALSYATSRAEGVLYDRAINGYEELTYDKNGQCVARKKKYCPRSLLEYLKANCPKYQSAKKEKITKPEKLITSFEVQSYEQQAN